MIPFDNLRRKPLGVIAKIIRKRQKAVFVCINGGGQPFVHPTLLPNEDDDILETYRQKRAAVLYSEDERQVIRQSHNNKDIQRLYDEFLGI